MLTLKLFILLMYEVLEPLQTYFLDRAMSPQNYPKHIGIRITQDAPPSYGERLEDNSRCSSSGAQGEFEDATTSESRSGHEISPLDQPSKASKGTTLLWEGRTFPSPRDLLRW